MIVATPTNVRGNAIMDYTVTIIVSTGIMAPAIRRALCLWFFYSRCSGSATAAGGETTNAQIVQTVGACNYVLPTHIFTTIRAMKKTLRPPHFRANPTVMNGGRP